MKTRYATNIKWDTDGEEITLPNEVKLPLGVGNCRCKDWQTCENNSESVNGYLSDEYGWLVEDYQIIEK